MRILGGHRFVKAAVALLVVPALVGACGGDDDAGDAVPAEEFAETVNALCQERDAAAEELFTSQAFTEEEPTDEQLQEVVEGFIPIIEDYREGVADAGPPEGLEDDYDEYLDLIDDTLADFEEAADDPERARELFEQEDDDRFAELERKLGLEDCADSSA